MLSIRGSFAVAQSKREQFFPLHELGTEAQRAEELKVALGVESEVRIYQHVSYTNAKTLRRAVGFRSTAGRFRLGAVSRSLRRLHPGAHAPSRDASCDPSG